MHHPYVDFSSYVGLPVNYAQMAHARHGQRVWKSHAEYPVGSNLFNENQRVHRYVGPAAIDHVRRWDMRIQRPDLGPSIDEPTSRITHTTRNTRDLGTQWAARRCTPDEDTSIPGYTPMDPRTEKAVEYSGRPVA
jgi:hypothetical protein